MYGGLRWRGTGTIKLKHSTLGAANSMYDTSEDVAGECNAQLHIGDTFGDNHSAMRCGEKPGHEEPHKEVFARRGKPVVITWYGCCREEEEEENAVLEAKFGPYCEECCDYHHGKCAE